MIKVVVGKNIIKISGHARYSDNGNDIVCASVSSILYTSINNIKSIDVNAIEVIDEKDMVIKILSNDDIILKLIDSMLSLLEELAKQYPNNIKISKGE